MLTIEFKFLAGRYHATPWGRQVNEGAVEWPPAPWRLLRSLLAVWHLKCPDISETDMRDLVGALSPLPHYKLPAALTGHTRHYMPVENDDRSKIFDAFVVVDPSDPLLAVWPDVDLDDQQQELLSRLLTSLQFFGRAESWVEAKIAPNRHWECNAVPLEALDFDAASDRELVRLLAVAPEEGYQVWRKETREKHIERKLADKIQKQLVKGKPVDKVKLTKTESQAIESNLPQSVFDALHTDTSQLRSAGWSAPPASQWVTYGRPRNAFASKPTADFRGESLRPTVARYAVCGKVVPRLTEALWIGERSRTLLMGCSKATQENKNAAWVFSGKEADGSSSQEGHQHAHFLCEASAGSAKITHLNVYAPSGFEESDRLAFSRFTKVWGHGGNDLQLVLIGVGHAEDFGGNEEHAGKSKLMAESRVWVSRTPFVPTRHLKIKRFEQKNVELRAAATTRELVRMVRLELLQRSAFTNLAEQVTIEPILHVMKSGTQLGGRFTSWLKFRRERKDGNGRHGGSLGFGFRLTFPKPVRGPIALGYGCHFGLGQFVAE